LRKLQEAKRIRGAGQLNSAGGTIKIKNKAKKKAKETVKVINQSKNKTKKEWKQR
jgi:hypothetical protein